MFNSVLHLPVVFSDQIAESKNAANCLEVHQPCGDGASGDLGHYLPPWPGCPDWPHPRLHQEQASGSDWVS